MILVVMHQKFAEQTASFYRLRPLFTDSVHFLPTPSTIYRLRPLFTDTVHYLPTERSLFCRHVPNAPTFAPLRNVSFSLSGHPTPTPPRRSELRPDLPARRPVPGSCRPACPVYYLPTWYTIYRHGILFTDKRFIICRQGILFTDMVYYLPTKGSLFTDKVYYLPTWYTIYRQKVYYLPTLYTIYRQRFITK